ncbi:MAG: TIGR00730 family Rossman fold protein, partial [Patescibacteria group bacterium]
MPDEKSMKPPTIHRMEGELKVCDPAKTDRTHDVESWRIFKIMAEFVDGFNLLRKYRLAATFFGSARTHLDERYYEDATVLAGRLSKAGFTIVTGGAAGIMEAASKGAYDAGGKSVGLNIELAAEQGVNQYLTDTFTFNYFFTRKVMLAFASEVYIFFPGGFGTLDEFLEIITLVQTRKIKRIPIILYGTSY